MARPQLPYRPTWGGDPIVGLYRGKDGRWRINATGKKFTCHDERLAIAKFEQWRSTQRNADVLVPIPMQRTATPQPDEDVAGAVDFMLRHRLGPGLHRTPADESTALHIPESLDEQVTFMRSLPEKAMGTFIRDLLINRREYLAEITGLPQILAFAQFEIPKTPIRISAIIAAYREHSGGSKTSKQQALSAFELLVKHSGAKTLADLTDERLISFRSDTVKNQSLTSSGTISAYFNRIRAVLSMARRAALDSVQINAALARCKAKLYSPENNVEDNPQPITPKNFHKLLNGCAQTDIPDVWRAMLLLGLNCSLYMEDVCDLRWKMFDLTKRTFLTRRKKKGRCIRAAVLWDETVVALRAIPRRAHCPYVFVSTHGTRYNKNTKINDFKDFRKKVGVTDVTFSHLRDGAYTAASHDPTVADRFARLLNGHKNVGLEDKYVARHPEIVRPACEAVYKRYFG